MGGSCDHRNGKCHYGNWYGKEVESAVAFNGHTDDACTQNSQCRQYPRGSCDHRNGKCHYGNWYGKEDAVGAYCWEFAGKKAECEAQPGCKYFDNLGFCNSGSDHYRNEKAVGGFHTDRSCQGHSECTEHSMGSCDNRNGKCHYGYWYKGEAEAAVGAYCWEFAGKKAECEAQPGCKYF